MAQTVFAARAGKLTGPAQQRLYLALAAGLIGGYILGMVLMETADVMFTTGATRHVYMDGSVAPTTGIQQGGPSGDQPAKQTGVKQWPGDSIHTLLTSNGSPYQNFQGRIMYATYKLVQKLPGGEKLTGFTRIMHRTVDDEVMDEIPTFRADPLHPKCDTYCDFPVADRPNAVQQWIKAAVADPSLVQGAWVFLVECDYVWMKPLPAPDAYSSEPGLQFHFDYIMPDYPTVPAILQRLAKAAGYGDLSGTPVPPSGPAPALLRFSELQTVTPAWEKITAVLEADAAAVKVLGWVREMYAWDLAIAVTGVKIRTQDAGVSPLLAQPPHDQRIGPASICHYTWGAIYNDTKGQVWRWEKRDYTAPIHALKVPKLPMPPQPFQPDTWHLQDGLIVTKDLHDTLTAMLGQMNRGIKTLPDLSDRLNKG